MGNTLPMEMVEIEPIAGSEPPELENESALLHSLAVPSCDPELLKRYVWMKTEARLWAGGFIVLSPLLILLSTMLPHWGLPRWSAQLAVCASLLLFFLVFGLMLARLVRGSKLMPALGFEILGQSEDSPKLGARALRHNRDVEWSPLEKTYVCRVLIAAPDFSIVYRRGRFQVSSNTPLVIRSLLAGLRPDRRWRGLEVGADAKGLEARRPLQRSRDWPYDLWLLERIASLLGR